MSTATRVVKLGGSLLTGLDVRAGILSWFRTQRPRPTLVIVGGGELADAVRRLDRQYTLAAEVAHWQAIRAMQVNAFVLHQLWSDSTWVERLHDWQAIQSWTTPPIGILDPLSYLTWDEPSLSGPRLPCGWHVTSDSIAARLACGLGHVELILLKSTLPSGVSDKLTYERAVELGLVDDYFPVAAQALTSVRAINLRAATWPELRLSNDSR